MISLSVKTQFGMRAELNMVEEVELEFTDTNVMAGAFGKVK
jgi:hypothetical protein